MSEYYCEHCDIPVESDPCPLCGQPALEDGDESA